VATAADRARARRLDPRRATRRITDIPLVPPRRWLPQRPGALSRNAWQACARCRRAFATWGRALRIWRSERDRENWERPRGRVAWTAVCASSRAARTGLDRRELNSIHSACSICSRPSTRGGGVEHDHRLGRPHSPRAAPVIHRLGHVIASNSARKRRPRTGLTDSTQPTRPSRWARKWGCPDRLATSTPLRRASWSTARS